MSTTFAFGKNWSSFLDSVKETSVESSAANLKAVLGDIRGKTFIDIGCGSGLSSLAAHRLGAVVRSIDVDKECVACTLELQSRFGAQWPVELGSALDERYLRSLGQFDVVYSWGVLHHTGDMWRAITNVTELVKPGGTIWLALYNDQGVRSRYWKAVKRTYNSGAIGRNTMVTAHLPMLLARYGVRAMKGSLSLDRGMRIWTDYIDWLGGYPFEVIHPATMKSYFGSKGFEDMSPANQRVSSGCRDYVYRHPRP